MPTYKTTVQFVRPITITAKDAAEANQELEDLVSESEMGGDVRCDSFVVFQDEPVECPKCKGDCVNEEGENCAECHGEGSVPFSADKEAA